MDKVAALLLAWYDRYARVLPWRAPAGAPVEAYRVWLSEVMLQQTGVQTVIPYYNAFLVRWPSVAALAAASLDEVLTAWAGLGYYARARNLHRCARLVAREHGGRFPDCEAELLKLPGIGAYSAAAIAAIAFQRPAVVVDGNVERVLARLFAVETPLPAAKPELKRQAAALTPPLRPGDYAQALMDLGATICLPRQPKCHTCPLAGLCMAKASGRAGVLPRRTPAKERPTRRMVAFWITAGDGSVLLRRRPESGLLGGMMEVPSTEWREQDWSDQAAQDQAAQDQAARDQAPLALDWIVLPGLVRHTFTHFHLEAVVWAGRIKGRRRKSRNGERWVRPDDFANQALPSVMRKIIHHASKQAAAEV